MEWKMSETRERFRSAKERLFRLIKGLETENSKSFSTPVFTVTLYETLSSSKNNSLEAELKKAEALMYQRMSDRPK